MTIPPSLVSITGSMVVVFVSDRSVSGAGFFAHFRAIDASEDCHRTFTAPSGQISFNASEMKISTFCDYYIMVGFF